MATQINKTLTIIEVKDNLGKVLKGHLTDFEKLIQKDKKFHERSRDERGRFVKEAKTMGKALKDAALIGGAALVATLGASVKKAEEFNSEFRTLSNLNLDKTPEQIRQLEKDVLAASFATGRASKDINQAFFDIQSGTGKFGQEVALATQKASDFSRAFKIDFNTTVEGAVKGMKNFNLEANDLDMFFGSMVKTVQTGIVTFEQLAQVQTDFAGAANTAGQNVDSANKLFSVFTAKAKSAEEAATLTKSAFTDLLKPATLKAFDKIGVQVFDTQTGKVKQLDQIVSELNEKFKGFRGNDQALNTLVNQFSGSEGLVALIGETAKNGDNMLEVFRQFDNTEFRLGDALRDAKTDTAVMAEIARNRLDVVMTRIGQTVLPLWVNLLGKVNDEILPGIEAHMPEIERFLLRMGTALEKTVNQLSTAVGWIDKAIKGTRSFFTGIENISAAWDPMLAKNNREDLLGMGADEDFVKRLDKRSLNTLRRDLPGIYDDDGKLQVEAATALAAKLEKSSNEAAQAFGAQLEKKIATRQVEILASKGISKPTASNPTAGNAPTPDADLQKIINAANASSAGRSVSQGLRGVQGTDKAARHISVRIDKITGIENLVTNVNQAIPDIEEAIKEALVRSIRDAEIAVSQNYD